jgi:hypothetical protein
MDYKTYWWLRTVLALGMLVYAGCIVFRFATAAKGSLTGIVPAAEVVFWTIVPPLWFFFEFYLIDKHKIDGAPDPANVKAYADYAGKIWAAVLAAVLFLFALQKT